MNTIEIHNAITDRICELENYIEGFSQEEIETFAEAEVNNAREAIDALERARNIIDYYMY